MRARRIEFGAGVAACALSLLAFVFVLFAPIIPVCTVTVAGGQHCPAHAVRYEALAQSSPDAGVWLFVLGMLALSLIGGAGAIVEARSGRQVAAIPLWGASVLVLAGCAFGASGAGIIYLPSVLALALAAYASVLSRMAPRNGQA
ncbi:MAG: hypothetical protein ACM3N4_02900 [Nitrososphaerota archaeon]